MREGGPARLWRGAARRRRRRARRRRRVAPRPAPGGGGLPGPARGRGRGHRERVSRALLKPRAGARPPRALRSQPDAAFCPQIKDTILAENDAAVGRGGGARRPAHPPTLESATAALQRDSSTYCEAPGGADEASFASFLDSFDPSAPPTAARIAALLGRNAFMAELRSRIVPLVVSETDFWARYFFRLAALRAAHGKGPVEEEPPPPPKPPVSGAQLAAAAAAAGGAAAAAHARTGSDGSWTVVSSARSDTRSPDGEASPAEGADVAAAAAAVAASAAAAAAAAAATEAPRPPPAAAAPFTSAPVAPPLIAAAGGAAAPARAQPAAAASSSDESAAAAAATSPSAARPPSAAPPATGGAAGGAAGGEAPPRTPPPAARPGSDGSAPVPSPSPLQPGGTPLACTDDELDENWGMDDA